MVSRQKALFIRKAHRYLGIFLGLQFLLWTVSGLYFSWTNLDEIHGDHFKRDTELRTAFNELLNRDALEIKEPISSLELIEIDENPYYWINNSKLYHAITGKLKEGLTEQEALSVANRFIRPDLEVNEVELLEEAGAHHEYRGRPLPAYVISYKNPDNLKAYVAVENGAFQTVRHRSWRWFDFLWMTHTMDYKGRDNFNTLVLRSFSLLGLITVCSGFLLWFTSSPTLRKLKKKKTN